MMFDPATLGASLQPGDKMSLIFHKGQPKPTTPSFMDNVRTAQGGPQGGAGAPPAMLAPIPAPMPPPPPSPPEAGGIAPPTDLQHQMMMNALRARLGGGGAV